MKRLGCFSIFIVALGVAAIEANAKCQRSDAGPVLQVALDVDCAIHWLGHAVKVVGKTIKRVASKAITGLD